MTNRATRRAAAAIALAALGGCAASPPRDTATVVRGPAAVRAGADTAPRPAGRAADVQFMHHMMHHHAQALVMTALVPEHTAREDLRRLARRIDLSQRDEMELMRAWLVARGASVPGSPAYGGTGGHAHHTGASSMSMDMTAMPGMLTAAQLGRLRGARGAEFDRLFLEGMIQHHEGAIEMVAALFRTPGAGQDAELFRFASDVDADQRAEIARMRQLLAAMRP
jgi:uncharacterized protein (DUF305 family)